jgi:hypothetical protein
MAVPAFIAPDIAARLGEMSDAELDAPPFGVVETNHESKVLRYNATGSRYAGLPPERAVGRKFFLHLIRSPKRTIP